MTCIEQQREQDLAASRETKQLIQSNSRAIQAMLDAMTEEKQEQEEFRQQIAQLDDVVTA